MKLTLPGPVGVPDTYYIRVRSAGADVNDVNGGESTGRYELQVHLQSRDEAIGSTITHADIRYAKTGVRIVGPPGESPLVGEVAEDESLNDYFEELPILAITDQGFVNPSNTISHPDAPYEVSAQLVGDLLSSRKGAISIFGTLEDSDFGLGFGQDVDWYQFDVFGDSFLRFAGDEIAFDVLRPRSRSTWSSMLTTRNPIPSSVCITRWDNSSTTRTTRPWQPTKRSRKVPILSAADRSPEKIPSSGAVSLFPGRYLLAVSPVTAIPMRVADNLTGEGLDPAVFAPVNGDPNRGFAALSLDPTDRGFYVDNPNPPFGGVSKVSTS